MPTTPEPRAARPAETVNEEIRALWLRAGGRLTAEQRRLYDCLLAEWGTAMRMERSSSA